MGEIYFHAGIWQCLGASLSLCVANLTKLIQQLTHRNKHFVSLGQHGFNNFFNLSRLILKIGGFSPVLANHKKINFQLKRAFFGDSQLPGRRLSNQLSSFRLEKFEKCFVLHLCCTTEFTAFYARNYHCGKRYFDSIHENTAFH